MPGWNPPVDGYVGDVPVLTREEFDAIEFEAACTGDHESAAERMNELATTGTQSESMPRAEAFIRAGEQWLLADDPRKAANGFRLAIADGGPVDVDPRVPLCRALFQLGNRTEAYALIEDLRAQGKADARACDLITECWSSSLTCRRRWNGPPGAWNSCSVTRPRLRYLGQCSPPTPPDCGTCSGSVTESAMTCGCRRTSTTACSPSDGQETRGPPLTFREGHICVVRRCRCQTNSTSEVDRKNSPAFVPVPGMSGPP